MDTTPVKLPIHHHHIFPLVGFYIIDKCEGCHVKKVNIYGGYVCNKSSCIACFHKECAEAPSVINHLSHPQHPLLLTNDSGDGQCDTCGQKLLPPCYSCPTHEFKLDLICGIKPPPAAIEHPLCHYHPLVFLKIREEGNVRCELCKYSIDGPSYSCLECKVYFHVDCVPLSKECDFFINRECIGLPRVININRHHHRISFTPRLGDGFSNCGVCRKSISQYYGAYYCSVCPNYAVHSRCVMNPGIWDYKELEGIPDEAEDIAPFKVMSDNLICHFSHKEHTLRLHKVDTINENDEHKRCKACSDPVGFGSIYVCEECCFFLHEKCANLPMKTKFVFHIVPYTLKVASTIDRCYFCGIFSDGFKYTAEGAVDIDVHCGSLSEPFVHDGHIHPLYFNKGEGRYCNGCYNHKNSYMLHCDDCDYNLCFFCASLPEKNMVQE